MFLNEVFPVGGVVRKEDSNAGVAGKGDSGLKDFGKFPFNPVSFENGIEESGDLWFEPLVDFWFRIGEFEGIFAEFVNRSDCYPSGEVAVKDAVGKFLGNLGIEGHQSNDA